MFMAGEEEPDDQKVALEMDTHCLVTASQGTAYGCVREAVLDGNVLRLSLDPDALESLRLDEAEIEAVIEAPAESIARCRRTHERAQPGTDVRAHLPVGLIRRMSRKAAASVREPGGPLVGRADEDEDQGGQVCCPGVVVRVARGLQGADLVQSDSFPLQDVGEGEHGKAGVAIREGVKEGHVEVGPGRAGGQGDSRIGAVAQTLLEVALGVWCQGVAFPAAFGEGVASSEPDLRRAKDQLLPSGQKRAGERAPVGSVCARLSQRREQSVASIGVRGTASFPAPGGEAVHGGLDRGRPLTGCGSPVDPVPDLDPGGQGVSAHGRAALRSDLRRDPLPLRR